MNPVPETTTVGGGTMVREFVAGLVLVAICLGVVGVAEGDDDLLLPTIREMTSEQKRQKVWEQVAIVSDAGDVEECRSIGRVEQSMAIGGLFQGTGRRKAEKWLRRNTWEACGDTILVTWRDGGYWGKQEIGGEAYVCGDVLPPECVDGFQAKIDSLETIMAAQMAKIDALRESIEESDTPQKREALTALVSKYRGNEAERDRIAAIITAPDGSSFEDPLLAFD
jgi:hypothetical protein